MDRRSRQLSTYFMFLVIAVAPLFFLGLSNHGLWTADEPRVAEIGREMALSGNLAVPTLDRRPFLEEPPLYYASLASVFKLFGGASDRIVRLPSAIFALGGVVALFFLGATLFGPRIGFFSAFIMATCGEYFRVAHWVIVDSALTCFVVLGLTFFITAYFQQERRKRVVLYSLCYFCCTLAFYAKGLVGIAIPGLAVLTFLLFEKNLKEVARMHIWLGAAIFAALALPWFIALYNQGGVEYLKVFLVHNHLERFAGGSTGHHQPFYYYLTQFPGGFLPWSLLIVPVFLASFRKVRALKGKEKSGLLFAQCWFIAGLLFLSIASTKRVLYLMPIFAPVSMLTAWYIDATLARAAPRWSERFFEGLFGLAPLITGLTVVPAYIYFLRKYSLAVQLREVLPIASFSLAAVLLAIAGLRFYKKDVGRLWFFSSASVFSLLLLGLVTAFPILDRYKSFVPFCNDIIDKVPATVNLYSYQPDETLRGAVPFYTGRFLAETETIASLRKAAEREGKIFVVIRDSRGNMEREILSTGLFSVLSRRGIAPDRSLLLLSGASPAAPSARRLP